MNPQSDHSLRLLSMGPLSPIESNYRTAGTCDADGHVFLSKIVEMHSGYTYFRWISMISIPFTVFFNLNFRS